VTLFQFVGIGASPKINREKRPEWKCSRYVVLFHCCDRIIDVFWTGALFNAQYVAAKTAELRPGSSGRV
jgi:hypothetical protein